MKPVPIPIGQPLACACEAMCSRQEAVSCVAQVLRFWESPTSRPSSQSGSCAYALGSRLVRRRKELGVWDQFQVEPSYRSYRHFALYLQNLIRAC
jgi:hypothetical protein